MIPTKQGMPAVLSQQKKKLELLQEGGPKVPSLVRSSSSSNNYNYNKSNGGGCRATRSQRSFFFRQSKNKCTLFYLLLGFGISWLAYKNVKLLGGPELMGGGPSWMAFEEFQWTPAKATDDYYVVTTKNATTKISSSSSSSSSSSNHLWNSSHPRVVPRSLHIYWLTHSSSAAQDELKQEKQRRRMETAFRTMTLHPSSGRASRTIHEKGIVTQIPWWTPQQVIDIYRPATSATSQRLLLTNNVTLKHKEEKPKAPKEYSYDDAACLITHLTALVEAYDAGHEQILVVQDDAILTQDFFNHWHAAATLAPRDWTILQWTTSNLATIEQSVSLPEPWISWLPDLWGTHSYLINRDGLAAIRNRLTMEDGMLQQGKEEKQIFFTVDDRFRHILLADELLFSIPDQHAYTSTFPWIMTDVIRNTINKSGGKPFATSPHEGLMTDRSSLPTRNESLLVFMNIRFSSSKQLIMEMDRTLLDIESVCWVHRHTKCDWIIRGIFTHEYLYSRFQQKYATNLPLNIIRFEKEIGTARFNKFGLLTDHLTKMSQYDLVLIKDNDQRLAGFPWASFIEKRGNALVGGPLRQAPEESFSRNRLGDLSQHYKFHDARGWKKSGFAAWANRLFIQANAIDVPFLEMYFNVFDGAFAQWFFSQILTQNFTQQDSCWGPDFLWCPAAQEYAASSTSTTTVSATAAATSNVTQRSRPTMGCVLVPFVSVHDDTRQIDKDGEAFNQRGYAAVEMLRASNPAFERWYKIALKYARGVIAWRQLDGIAQHCRTRLLRGVYKKKEDIDFAKCRDAGMARKTIV